MRLVIAAAVAGSVLAIGTVAAQEQGQADSPAFLAGSKFAFVDIQQIAAESSDGQVSSVKVQELSEQKLEEIESKNKELQGQIGAKTQELQAAQTQLQQGQTVMSAEARLSLQREIARLQVDVQRVTQDSQAESERFSQDAEAEVQVLQQELQMEFQRKLVPAVEQVAADRQLHFIFAAGEGGLVWANRALDITQDVIDLLNEGGATTP